MGIENEFMPSDFQRYRTVLPRMKYWQYSAWMKLLTNSLSFDLSDPAKFRHHALIHYYKHGYQATIDAFGISRTSLYRWKKEYELYKGKLNCLIPKSTKPKTTRRMLTDPRLVEFIRYMRENYGNIGKDKIKPFLDSYAVSLDINSISKTTIGKIIKRRHMFYDKPIRNRKKRSHSGLRARRCPKLKQPGYLQMDGIVIYADNHKHCFISIIDIFTKYAQVTKVPTLSSQHSLTCYLKYTSQYTYPIHSIQTDNGSEFLKDFDSYLEKHKINHVFSYPRSPRINGYIERFNRTVQEECIYRMEELYFEPEHIQTKLDEYLNWYNYKRPHASLNYQAPVTFLLNYLSQM